MNILRKIWSGSKERDILGLKHLVPFLLIVGMGVWLWSPLIAAGWTMRLLWACVVLCVVSWWIAKKLGDENSWHLLLGVVVFLLFMLKVIYEKIVQPTHLFD